MLEGGQGRAGLGWVVQGGGWEASSSLPALEGLASRDRQRARAAGWARARAAGWEGQSNSPGRG